MIEKLRNESEAFNFFQAVRILEQWQRETHEDAAAIGGDGSPSKEAVRFLALPALSFPGQDIASLKEKNEQWVMEVAFTGLTGPQAVLPEHYTRLLLERLRSRDSALRNFFDLFNHRVVSLFFRAWEKHYLPAQFDEHSHTAHDEEPLFTQGLFALAGLGEPALRDRQSFPDAALLFYSGHFSNQRRTSEGLEQILSEYFNLPVEVQEFAGQWLRLERHHRSQLPRRDQTQTAHNVLGSSIVIGERVWDVQSKFRVVLGPLQLKQFEQFLPSGDAYQPLLDLTRSFAGVEYDFDIVLVLKADQVPPCCLGDKNQPAHLGWNTWLGSESCKDDVADAVFASATL